MLAYQIEIDGKKFLVAGVTDWGFLGIHINANRGDPKAPAESARTDQLDLSVGGITETDSNGEFFHFRWPRKELSVGSRVTVTLIETENTDPPIKRYRSDNKVQEEPFTEEEIREMRWKTYLELKREFEPETKG